MTSQRELVVLSTDECLSMLGTRPVGRVVFSAGALPAVQPVNFILDGDDVVFRTAVGSKLAAATRNAVVAFEVDDIDMNVRSGWSVTVTGRTREITDEAELTRLARLLSAWAPGSRDHFIAITVELVSGRRLAAVPA